MVEGLLLSAIAASVDAFVLVLVMLVVLRLRSVDK